MKTVLLAAGFGSRLWPLSTSDKPKQFQTLLGDQSLLQYTYELFAKITPVEELYVLTKEDLKHWVIEQLPALNPNHIITVPDRRNTLPHTIIALRTITSSPDELVFFAGTDIWIESQTEFVTSLKACIAELERTKPSETITLVGSSAPRPDVNAGYLQVKDGAVIQYVEKPSHANIEQLAKEGTVLKTMFSQVLSLNALRAPLSDPHNELGPAVMKLLDASKADLWEVFLALPFCDISNAAFMFAPNLHAYEVKTDFADLGTFAALHKVNDKDEQNNVARGNVIFDGDCHGNFVINETTAPLVVIDTSDAVIIQTASGSLCAPLEQSSRVGEIYKQKIYRAQHTAPGQT